MPAPPPGLRLRELSKARTISVGPAVLTLVLLAATTVIVLPFATTLSGWIGAVGADRGAPAAETAALPPPGRSRPTLDDAAATPPTSTPAAAPAPVAAPADAPAGGAAPLVAAATPSPAAAAEPVRTPPPAASTAAEPPATTAAARPGPSAAVEPVAAPPVAAPPVAAPPSAPAVLSPPGPAPRSAAYTIQVKAVPVRSEADALAGMLTGKGFNAYVQPVSTAAQPMFRVRVGPFRDRADAEASAARLVAEEGLETWIITLPPGGR